MDTLRLGHLIEGEQYRDAVHIAVAPVVAKRRLRPGALIQFADEDNKYVVEAVPATAIGIADPFLLKEIRGGERFWMFLYPGSITSLRHDWTHPAFRRDEKRSPLTVAEASRLWIDDWASQYGLTGQEMIDRAWDYIEHDNYLDMGGRLEGESVPEEFWGHFERVTGRNVSKRGSFFTCSC